MAGDELVSIASSIVSRLSSLVDELRRSPGRDFSAMHFTFHVQVNTRNNLERRSTHERIERHQSAAFATTVPLEMHRRQRTKKENRRDMSMPISHWPTVGLTCPFEAEPWTFCVDETGTRQSLVINCVLLHEPSHPLVAALVQ
jgi:hypothetical protein